MPEEINVYCDESCHLENDNQPVMVLGGIWCRKSAVKAINEQIRAIKSSHNLNERLEIKWTKVSTSKIDFYRDLIDYFFDESALHFRGLIALQKSALDHDSYLQTHDIWYYKMYFNMIKLIIDPSNKYNIYLDIKDTRSSDKIKKLHDILSNNIYDFEREIIEKIQSVRSHEVEILQLTDLLAGALSYFHRHLDSNSAKRSLIDEIKRRSGYSLTMTTLARESKFNLLVWTPHLSEEDQ